MKRIIIATTFIFSMLLVNNNATAKPYFSEVTGSDFTFSNEEIKSKSKKPIKKNINKNTKAKKKVFVKKSVEIKTTSTNTDLISKARQHLNKTASQLGLPLTLWCADFMNLITGGGTRSRLAKSYLSYGSPASKGCVGCIAVMGRKGGGHVGVVSGYKGGNPIIISGNYSRKVKEAVVSASRIIAYRSTS